MERRHGYGLALVVTGLVLAAVQTLHGVQQTDRLLVFLFEAGPFVLIGLTISYAGYWLSRTDRYERDIPRVLVWTVGSTLLFASIAALMLFSQRVSLGTLDRAAFVAIDLVTVGAVVGVVVGLYDARGQRRLRRLQSQRDRIEEFANKAADVNNYGRALNRSSSVHEVSGLCIEAMQTLLGLPEVAVVAVDDEGVEVIDNTIINADGEDLVSLATVARDQEPVTVITHRNLSGPLGDRGETALSMVFTAWDDTAIVAIAVVSDAAGFEDEDVQLIELLGSHAGTAFDGIEERVMGSP